MQLISTGCIAKVVLHATRESHLVFQCQVRNLISQNRINAALCRYLTTALLLKCVFSLFTGTKPRSVLTFMLFIRWVVQPHSDQDEENKEWPHNLRQQLQLQNSNTQGQKQSAFSVKCRHWRPNMTNKALRKKVLKSLMSKV